MRRSVLGDLSLLLVRWEGPVHTLAPLPQCQPWPSSRLPLSPPHQLVGESVDGRSMDFGFYNVTTVGWGEGDVPCISVKYLIYLNINKIKLFVKFLVLCSCSGPGVKGEVAEPGVEAASCPRAWWASLVCGLVFSLLRRSCSVFREHDCSRPFSIMRTSVYTQICYSDPFPI